MKLKNLLTTLDDTGFRVYDIFGDIIYDSFLEEYHNAYALVEYFDFQVKKVTSIKSLYQIPMVVIYL